MYRRRLFAACMLGALAAYGCDDSSGSATTIETKVVGEGEACDGTAVVCGTSLDCRGSVCVKVAAIGGACDDKDIFCADGICRGGLCVKSAALGEACNDTDMFCADGICRSGLCVKSAALGEACNNADIFCAEGKCEQGVCTKIACDDDHPCGDDGDCVNGFCVDTSGIEEECGSTEDCGDPQKVCDGGECVDIHHIEPGGECSGRVSDICDGDTSCYKGTCLTQQEIDNYGKCQSDTQCTDPNYPNCLQSGNCGNKHEVGEQCDNDLNVCADGLTCNFICTKIMKENEDCDEYNGYVCGFGLGCYDGKCHGFSRDHSLGEECDPRYAYCNTQLACQDGHCTQLGSEGEDCNEEEYRKCKQGFQCWENKCRPVGNACQSLADCTDKDSFCCKDESCGAVGFCIPYDDHVTHDETCGSVLKPGIFEAQVQCRWQPPADAYPDSKMVEMHPLVGHFGNKAGLDTVIAFSSNKTRYSSHGSIDKAKHQTAIRFINPTDCSTLETIQIDLDCAWYNYPAAADVDGDGLLELFVISYDGFPVMFKWDAEQKKHKKMWTAKITTGDTPMLYDVNGDGTPELLVGTGVINVADGSTIFTGISSGRDDSYRTMAVGNLNGNSDGISHLVVRTNILAWNKNKNSWISVGTLDEEKNSSDKIIDRLNHAYADFGTPGATAADFDFEHLDGLPEIVTSGGGGMSLFALIWKENGNVTTQRVRTVHYSASSIPIPAELGGGNYTTATSIHGGPITIGDFDNDGLPEVGLASSGFFGVYDFRCPGYIEGECAAKDVLWERWSQDASSGRTGSSLFDFDGDGQAEAVYADECFTRVYDGKTGKILFSAKRSSSTSIEAPVIADVDGDGSAEILMGSDNNIACYDGTFQWQTDKYVPLKIHPSHLTQTNIDNGTYNKNYACKTQDSSQQKKCIDLPISNAVDPIHEGIWCVDDEDCPKGLAGSCNKDVHLCTCSVDDDCNTLRLGGPNSRIIKQYVCAPPIDPEVGMMVDKDGDGKRTMLKTIGTKPTDWKEGDYKVCRATRVETGLGVADMMIFKDRLDRWVSSRALWNQHSYNIINIRDDDDRNPSEIASNAHIDGQVPNSRAWLEAWYNDEKTAPRYNNYRMNKQGKYGAGTAPDITGRFDGDVCGTIPVLDDKGEQVMENGKPKERHVIAGKVCNRGTKPVDRTLKASFFYYDENVENHRGKRICTSQENRILGIGECDKVGCTIESDEEFKALTGKKILMVSNLDEDGLPSTVECNNDNNTDTITVESCSHEIEIVN